MRAKYFFNGQLSNNVMINNMQSSLKITGDGNLALDDVANTDVG